MFTVKNKKNKTLFLGRRNHGDQQMAEMFYSLPESKKAKKASKLTIKVGNQRIDLNGREIHTLRTILGQGLILQSSTD